MHYSIQINEANPSGKWGMVISWGGSGANDEKILLIGK